MPAKRYIVRLSLAERQQRIQLVKTGKAAAYKRQRAQILLNDDVSPEGPGLKDQTIAQNLGICQGTVERLRCRMPRAERYSGASRRWPNRLRRRVSLGASPTGCPNPRLADRPDAATQPAYCRSAGTPKSAAARRAPPNHPPCARSPASPPTPASSTPGSRRPQSATGRRRSPPATPDGCTVKP